VRLATTVPTADPRRMGALFAELEALGYDTAFSFEARHDPFLPLAVASTTTAAVRLGTAVAIGFARNPMVLANTGYDLQVLTEGRFVLGLGTQVRPHIEHRFGETWSHPAARLGELVRAIKAIWACWEGEAPLDFRGRFYDHTLMIPAFDPGPNPFRPPPVFTGGVGPRVTEVAGEVADGFLVHPFHTPDSLRATTLAALERGLDRSGRALDGFEVVVVTMVVTWEEGDGDAEEAARASLADQLAFYGSTPAYAPTLEAVGLGDLHPELNRLSKEGRWAEMAALVPDSFAEAVAVVGPRPTIAAGLAERVEGLGLPRVTASLVNNRHPDPGHFGDVVAELRARGHGA